MPAPAACRVVQEDEKKESSDSVRQATYSCMWSNTDEHYRRKNYGPYWFALGYL